MDYVNPRGVRFTQSSQKEGEYSQAGSACSPPLSNPLSCLSLDCFGPAASSSQEMESSLRAIGLDGAFRYLIQRGSLVDNKN